MHTETFTTRDGVNLHTVRLLPDSTPKATVLVVHGYGEHSGRYAHVMTALANAGYAAYALDHIGHGRSEGLRAFIDNFDIPVTHLKEFKDRVVAQQPDGKLFMLGHSMGALISLAFTLRYQPELDGLLISGAPVNADANVSPVMVQLGYILNRIVPRLPLLAPGGTNILSTDPAVGEAFAADPLCYNGSMRVGLGVALNETAKSVRARLPELTLPILIMHGEADTYVNPSGSKLAYEQVKSKDRTLKLYPGMYHEIMNERDKAVVLGDIVTWLDQHS